MVAARNPAGLIGDLEHLAFGLESLDLRAARIRGSESVTVRDRLVRTIRSYLIPRLTEPDRPLSVVFAGPTGAGKSTLINSVAGLPVSPAGPLRPTTSSPIVISNEAWSHRYQQTAGIECEVVEGAAPILARMAFIDTPDIDSTAGDHRRVAEALIDEADIVVFVTSALRYADLVPWEVLRRALARGAPVVNVINRVTAESSGAVVDMQARLGAAGLAADLIRVPEHLLGAGAQMVPTIAVQELRRRLVGYVDDAREAEKEVAMNVLAATVHQAHGLAESVHTETQWIASINNRVHAAFAGRADRLDLAAASGELITDGPAPTSRRERRRWRRRRRIDQTDVERYLKETERSLSSWVVTDIRSALNELGLAGLVDDSLTDLCRDVDELFAIIFGEWTALVARKASRTKRRSRPLATQLLVSSGLGGGDRTAGTMVFGLDRDVLIEEVSADIRWRLQILYDHVARRVVARVSDEVGDPDPGDLAERATGVVVSSHFAYA